MTQDTNNPNHPTSLGHTSLSIEAKNIKRSALLKQMLAHTEDFLQFSDRHIDYQKIVDDFLSLCSAKYAVFNLFNEDGCTFSTKAIAADKAMVTIVSNLIGYNFIEKKWPYDPVYYNRIKGSPMTCFNGLSDIIGDVMPKPIISILGRTINIGEIIVLKIARHDVILGDFTILMPRGIPFEETEIAQIYAKQVGLLLTRFKSEKKMVDERTLLETTLLSIGDGVITTDSSGKVTLLNKVAEDLTGYKRQDVVGQKIDTIFNTIDENSGRPLKNIIYDVIKTAQIITGKPSTSLISKEGITRPIEVNAAPILDNDLQVIGSVLVFRDYTEKRKKQAEISHLSFHDQLTGLYNRRYYLEELKRLDQERNLPLSIIMGDVNGLKLINDSFGHTLGDELLKKTAEILKEGSRADDIVARLGGDEFVLILPSTSRIQVKAIITRIKSLASQAKIMSTPLSISFGYGIKTNKNESIADIQKLAEDFMYKHKLYDSSTLRNKTIQLIMNTLYEKNEREMDHTQRVSELCEHIAVALDYDEDNIHLIKMAGLMHDIGKIAIDDSILNTTGDLSESQWVQVKRHSEIGYRILISSPEFADIAKHILQHHEKYDGSGYPEGLKGDHITRQARIISLADAYDAMTNPRSYGKIRSKEEAIKEIRRNMGTQFDPDIAQVLIYLLQEKNIDHNT